MGITNYVQRAGKLIDILCTRQKAVYEKFCYAVDKVKFPELSQFLLKLLD